MGIKYFFTWFKNHFAKDMLKLRRGQKFNDIHVSVDNLMIDMNGVFHNSTQKIYEYGNCKPPPRILHGHQPRRQGGFQLQLKVFEDVCRTIEQIFSLVEPLKRLILCVDGPAPQSKQNQQRQRRFRAAAEKDDNEFASFDSNCLTPGTKFMDYLTKYIDWYIRKRISEDSRWQNIEIILSNEKASGEGEHKCQKIGTPILLYNGMIKKVEDIQVGDQVIGDDGTVRNILSIVSGEDEMFEIIQNNGDNYTVNRNHILTLKIADHKHIYWNEKDGDWIVGWYNRVTNRYQRRGFCGLREGETTMDDTDTTCIECKKSYTTRENYSKHMKNVHSIIVPKMNTYRRTTVKTKDEAYIDALQFIETIQGDNILDISVIEYLKLPRNTQRKLYGFRCSGVSWDKKDVDIDPYLLGLWLGDGVSTQPIICTIDSEIVEYLEKYCEDNGFELTHNDKYIYRICDRSQRPSRIISAFQSYNLIQNKHIPIEYKVNDEDTRLKILAGIIDTDGNVTKGGRLIRISQCLEHEQLVNDIVYLSRSLGFCTNVRKEKCVQSYQSEKKVGICYQITLSGDLEKIPILLPRKKCLSPPVPGKNGRSILVDKFRTSIKVLPVGRDKYYGFNTDGNHRYLLGDFTVTHNCLSYIRYYGVPTDSYCIHGLDADLIMLAMGTHVPNFYILREDLYDRSNEFFCIRIGNVRSTLAELMRWECERHVFDPETAIDDFIFICFMVGNDFLPHVPSLEIIERGIEIMIDVYKQVGNTGGHLTENVSGNIRFIPDTLAMFLNIISGYEKSILEDKLSRKKSFFPDALLENCSVRNNDRYELDIDKYRNDYCIASFPEDVSIEQICHEYLEGLQWVLSYYTRGVPNWKWQFPYHYAPPTSVLVDHIRTFTFPNYGRTIPATPFQQLLSVLPPKSAQLIPHPLNLLLTSEDSPLRGICPDNFEVDLAGKRKEWEGIVLLPMVDFPVVNEAYLGKINEVDQRDSKRNVSGRSFVYVYTPNSNSVFKSYYGDIQECKVKTTMIDL